MINVSSWSIRNPIPAVMLFVLLTFAGMLAFNAMKVQNFPDIDLPTVMVTAALPGPRDGGGRAGVPRVGGGVTVRPHPRCCPSALRAGC